MGHPKADWSEEESAVLKRLDTPNKIQDFLDNILYNPEEVTRSPRYVMKNRKAHCFEGALFAYACLEFHGYDVGIVDLRAAEGRDDDHTIAVYKKNGKYGAVSKSNFSVLRAREPVYRDVRELVMSYFDFYFSTIGEKTLREYSSPMSMKIFDKDSWRTSEKNLDYIGEHLDSTRHFRVTTEKEAKKFSIVKGVLLKAGLLGSDPKGLFKPKK